MSEPIPETPPSQPPYPLGGVPPVPMSAPAVVVIEAPSSARGTIVGIAVVIGAIALTVGTFLEWLRAEIPGRGIVDANGWRNVYDHLSYGPGITALAVAAGLFGALSFGGFRGWWVRLPLLAAGSAALGLVVFQIVDVGRPGPGVTTTRELGLWVMLAGACIVTAAAMAVPGKVGGSAAPAMVTASEGAVGAVG